MHVDWVAGPSPLFKTSSLPDDLQLMLAFDGLQLVTMPKTVRKLYDSVRIPEGVVELAVELNAAGLCSFLKHRWQEIHGAGSDSATYQQTGMASLADRGQVITLLSFVLKDDWEARLRQQQDVSPCWSHMPTEFASSRRISQSLQIAETCSQIRPTFSHTKKL